MGENIHNLVLGKALFSLHQKLILQKNKDKLVFIKTKKMGIKRHQECEKNLQNERKYL